MMCDRDGTLILGSFLVGDIVWAHEEVKELLDGLADVVVRLPFSCYAMLILYLVRTAHGLAHPRRLSRKPKTRRQIRQYRRDLPPQHLCGSYRRV